MKSAEEMYREMLTIRVLEDKLQKYCDEGLAGDLHFNKGQEAIAVGVCAALRPSDHIVTHHRTIAHAIAKGVPMRPLVAELLGKRSGICGGQAGEMHLSHPAVGYDFSFQIIGTCIPVAAGIAWALKYHHKTDDVVAVFFGDACTSNGQFHEGLNIAAIKEVPLLMICENNGLAGNITPQYYMTKNLPSCSHEEVLCNRARSYGIPVGSIDGNDVLGVQAAIEEVSSLVRKTQRPYFLELKTNRLCWHKQGQRDVRSKETLEKLAEHEPLRRGVPPGFDLAKERAAIEQRVDEVLASVVADLPPEICND